jgi:hypothetical protein
MNRSECVAPHPCAVQRDGWARRQAGRRAGSLRGRCGAGVVADGSARRGIQLGWLGLVACPAAFASTHPTAIPYGWLQKAQAAHPIQLIVSGARGCCCVPRAIGAWCACRAIPVVAHVIAVGPAHGMYGRPAGRKEADHTWPEPVGHACWCTCRSHLCLRTDVGAAVWHCCCVVYTGHPADHHSRSWSHSVHR